MKSKNSFMYCPINDILFLDVHTELVHPDIDSRNLLFFFPSKLWVATTRNIRFSHYCSLKMDKDGSLLLWKNMIKARVLYRQVRILLCRGYSFLGDLKPYFWHVDKIWKNVTFDFCIGMNLTWKWHFFTCKKKSTVRTTCGDSWGLNCMWNREEKKKKTHFYFQLPSFISVFI